MARTRARIHEKHTHTREREETRKCSKDAEEGEPMEPIAQRKNAVKEVARTHTRMHAHTHTRECEETRKCNKDAEKGEPK